MSATPAQGAGEAATRVQVAVGVLVRGDGAVLLADRPEGKPYPGYWEFPGGKIEPGESVHAALARELREELGIQVARSYPWTVLDFDYTHARVRLHFRRVFDWRGEPRSLEGQRLAFFVPGTPAPQPLLPAAVPALRWAALPLTIGVWPQEEGSREEIVPRIDESLGRGQLLHLVPGDLARATQARGTWEGLLARARALGARLLVEAPPGSPGLPPCDGLVATADSISGAKAGDGIPLVGARADRPADLALAARAGCEFAIAAGRGAASAGATPFLRALGSAAPLPVFAELRPGVAALQDAWAAGLHGLAVTP